MNEQYDPTNAPTNDGITTQDIVSAGQRTNRASDSTQRDAASPAVSRPADEGAPDVASPRQAARDQRTRANDANNSTPPARQGDVNQRGTLGNDASGAAPGPKSGPKPGPNTGAARAAQQKNRDGMALAPLLPADATDAFQARWDAIQTAFVDEPRRVVEQADSLVAELMRQLAESFAQERMRLERQWDQSGDVSTEELRLALQRYRSFFQRLLSA